MRNILSALPGVNGELPGFYGWLAVGCILVSIGGWFYCTWVNPKPMKLRLWFVAGMVLLCGIGAGAYYAITLPAYTFPDGVSGVLVLRIKGDDAAHTLQRHLVTNLTAELSRGVPGGTIEVRAHPDVVSEGIGLPQAHDRARKIGRECNALLVIWGNRVGEGVFRPRLTAIKQPPFSLGEGDTTLGVCSIRELELPPEIAARPVYLARFLAGYSLYERSQYADALGHFEAALGWENARPAELAGVRFYVGTTHQFLSPGPIKLREHLEAALQHYGEVLASAIEATSPHLWAATQNNLGVVYQDFPAGNRVENLQRAIAYYQAALRVLTEQGFPADWAITQCNLGIAYRDIPTGNRGENLRQAIACFEAALRVSTERDFPVKWASTQNNLGNAYRDLPTGDRAENLQRAIAYYQAALRVFTEKDFPFHWAETQNNLGVAYRNLPTGDRAENLRRAIACYEAALRVRNERDYPADWGRTHINLGVAYRNLPTGDRAENLRRAIAHYDTALRVFTEKDFSVQWAMVQNNLGTAYADLPTGDRGENLRQAIAYYQAALRVRNERDYPAEWAGLQNNLGTAYADLPTGDRAENLRRAIACFEAALRIFTETAFPQYHEMAVQNLARARDLLREESSK